MWYFGELYNEKLYKVHNSRDMRFLLMANSNRGRIIAVCDILSRTEVKNRHIRPQYSDCRPSAEERPAISTKYTSLKVQWATAMLLIQHGPIFIRLAVVLTPKSVNPRKFELIAVQGHPRSSILVPMQFHFRY